MTRETEGPSSRAGPIIIILLRQGICLKTPVAMGKSMKFYTCGAYYPQRPLSREVGSWEHEVGKRSRDGGESMLRVRFRLQSPPEGEQASKPK